MQHQEDYPKNHAKEEQDDPKAMEGVYAGPAFFAQQNPAMFQTVYAGPDFFAQQDLRMFRAAYAGPTPPNGVCGIGMTPPANEKKLKWCPGCGRTIDESAKFCPECGEPQPKTDA